MTTPAPALVAVEPMPFVTLQDGGRLGWRRFGVSSSGAMDPWALAAANALVGNAADLAALEFGYGAGSWRVEAASCRLAVAGGAFRIHLAGQQIPPRHSFVARRGQTLRIEGAPDAVWGYLAAAHGYAVPPRLGSLSTHLRSRTGGVEGRAIQPGDRIALAAPEASRGPERSLPLAPSAEPAPICAVLGPQDDRFRAEAIAALFDAPWTVTVQSDRLGYCLAGPALAHVETADIVSDGVVPGCIQVPGSGQPIVLMRDCQPPGGYAKIATVISPDVARVAQARPGHTLRFRQVAVAEAQLLRARYIERLRALPATLRLRHPD
ncbi:MAG: biotin-dependent carboxyltransferase family protein [Acidisphaera sp.]|nr:biotin-dependent carboxyltransferase family protein [Acidisphaera sp.]